MDESKHFYVRDGQVLKSIEELAGSLKHDMSDETFSYHCNSEKNDFALWILHTMGNKKLSDSVAKAKTRVGMLRKLKSKK